METVPELLYKDNEELKDMMNCEEIMVAFIESLPDVASITKRSQQLVEENYALANQNLELKNEFEKARDVTLMKVQELTVLQTSFEQLALEHQKLTEKLAPTNIQELTLVAASQSEEESEEIAEEFLKKDIDINAFLDTYLKKRIESHLRKFKGEKLGTQLRELQKAGF